MMKTKVFQGLSIISILLLATSITAGIIFERYPNQMDQYFGTVSSSRETIRIGEGEDVEDPWTFKSDFTSAAGAIAGYREFAIRESQETNALLKNVNRALPLSKTAKVTLLGFRSFAPVYGNSAGSIADKHTIDTFETQIYNAFSERGFRLNPATAGDTGLYRKYITDNNISWGGTGYGATPPEYRGTAITDRVYELGIETLLELDPALRDSYSDYNDAAIVVLGRPGGESKNYTLDEVEGSTTGTIMGLSTEEREIIAEAKTYFNKVIVLINSVTTMEFKELKEDPKIDAIMWIGFPGAYGFYGVADNLNGTVTPSAYLTDTHPVNAKAAPAMQNFGSMTPWNLDGFDSGDNVNSYLVNAESIYSGYRYYETRYADIVNNVGGASVASRGTWTNPDGTISTDDGVWIYDNEVVYPFGYGLSYTTFEETIDYVNILGNKKSAEVHVTVKNTGTVAGKKAVQLYAQAPYTLYDRQHKVEKSAIQLMDYEKTKVLQPGASETLVFYVDMSNLASYDYKNAKTFIIDAGDYYFSIGNGVHDALNNILAAQGRTIYNGMTDSGDASKTYKWTWEFDNVVFKYSDNGTEITNRISEGDYSMDINSFIPNAVTYMSRSNWNGTFPTTLSGLGERVTERMLTLLGNDFIPLKSGETSTVKFGQQSELNLVDLKGADWDDDRWEELISKVTIAEFLYFAQRAFHNLEGIPSVDFPRWNADDGPGGSDTHYFNEGTYQGVPYADAEDYATSRPGTRVAPSPQNLAASFNKELAYENGEIIIGETSLILQLPIIIGPGMNLHRHGYNGRGGEYYSEDPILSGFTGSNVVQGAQSKGCIVNIKHAAFNDQEIQRSGICALMNEQTARELELRNLKAAFTAKGKPSSFYNDETKADTFKEGALGVMTSYNRIGIVASSANKGVMVDIMRNEWGFRGYNVTDFTGVNKKAAPKESILFGTTAFCGFGSPSVPYWNEAALSGDKDMCEAIHRNIKYILYPIARSNALNGLNSNYRIVIHENMTWWRATYRIAIPISSTLVLATITCSVLFAFVLKKKEE